MTTGFSTRCIYGPGRQFEKDGTGAVSFPIYQTATFAHPGVGQSTGYDYSRVRNPTREKVEQVVASLEGGQEGIAFASGMAAIAAVVGLFAPGDHLITDSDLYGGTTRYLNCTAVPNGVEVTQLACAHEDLEKFIKPNTKAIFIETPTNPMMNVIDIQKTAQICQRHNLLLIVDNTFLSPYFQKPLTLGADIVIHSGTKFLGGHNDTIAGFVVVSDANLAEKLRFISKSAGATLAPFDSWLVLRGIKTLPIRMEKAQANALAIANFLVNRPEVTKVFYPGLKDSPGYDISSKQATGFGSVITFEVSSRALALHILEATKLIPFAESLGGIETLLTYPVTQTHADVPEAQRLACGLTDRVLRMSVGIEDEQDLLADLTQAIESFVP